MTGKTIRISDSAHAALVSFAASEHASMQDVLDKAVEAYWRERFWQQVEADSLALRRDTEAWGEEVAERRLWEATLADGLDSP